MPIYIIERLIGHRYKFALFWTGTGWEANLSRAKHFATHREVLREVREKQIDYQVSGCYAPDISNYKNEVCA